MSFSVSFIGKPEAIKRKLVDESERLTGQSKIEFDTVKPALDTLLDQQVGNGVVSLSASGHAQFTVHATKADSEGTPIATDSVKTYGSCNVEVKSLGQLAE